MCSESKARKSWCEKAKRNCNPGKCYFWKRVMICQPDGGIAIVPVGFCSK